MSIPFRIPGFNAPPATTPGPRTPNPKTPQHQGQQKTTGQSAARVARNLFSSGKKNNSNKGGDPPK